MLLINQEDLLRKLIILLTIFMLLLSACGKSRDLNVMTFNIRYDNPGDGMNQWDNRKEMVAEVFREKQVDIAGMQEVLKHQLDYLVENLPEYEFYGLGRDDGLEAGEFCPVLFRQDRFELLEKNSFWLSETPEKPGNLCWNTVCNRICSWVKLKVKDSGEVFYFFNTHFSHVSDEARRKSADMLLQKISEIAGSAKVILTGDFNLTADTEAYQKLVSSTAYNIYDSAKLAAYDFDEKDHTFNGWGKSEWKPVIDYIFVSENIPVSYYEIFEKIQNDVYVSDHFPVIIRIKL